MKKLIFTILFLFAVTSHAQISTRQNPRSFSYKAVNTEYINKLELSVPDIPSLLIKQEKESHKFKPQSCAVLIPVNESLFDRCQKISCGDAEIYLLKIHCEGALALNLYSDDFFIPKGGELYLWNKDRSKCLGAFTCDNNTADGRFATDYVYNDEMIIEYYRPLSVTQKARLNIQKIGYFYRDVIDDDIPYKSGFNSAESCNVNVNCSEGNNFRNQQRAVVRMLIPINYYEAAWCSGTLINNTANDKTPYVISAAHCIEEVDNKSLLSQVVFSFNYESSGCDNVTREPKYQTMEGCSLVSYGKRYGYGDTDYLLLRLNNNIPDSYGAYWAGWSTSDQTVSGAVCIHHPAGDLKKISTVDGALQSMGYAKGIWDYNTHWMVKWKKTQHGYGVTQGGSSGGALFNADGLIIGTLSGGESSCSASDDNKVDWYGRFDVTFKEIKKWIDPDNYNYTYFAGMDCTDSASVVVTDSLKISLYPVPAKDNITIVAENMEQDGVLTVLDAMGRCWFSTEVTSEDNPIHIDISGLMAGAYYIRLYVKGNSVIEKFIVQ